LSRRRLGINRKNKRKPEHPKIDIPGDAIDDGIVARARKIGMIMDPATKTTPEEIDRVSKEMMELHLIEPVMLLTGPMAGQTYGPTKKFLEAFLDVRRQYMERSKTEKDRESATSYALSDTVRQILEETQPTMDRAVRLAKQMNYFFVMAMYMSMPGMHEKLGIEAWDFFPPVFKDKAMAGMEREQKKAGR
jgi:hypothetical protein